MYDGKGLRLWRGNSSHPDAEVLLKWPQVAKRIEALIENDRYLKAADFSRMPGYERDQMAGRVLSFYARLPEEIKRPFEGEAFNSQTRKNWGNCLKIRKRPKICWRIWTLFLRRFRRILRIMKDGYRFWQSCMDTWKEPIPSFRSEKGNTGREQ